LGLFDKLPAEAFRQIQKLNARLLPPEKYSGTLTLGLSALEETYLVTKNFIDGSIHVSERVLYEDLYHERRLGEYAGQKRLLVFVPGYMQAPSSFVRLERFLALEMFDVFSYVWGGFPYSQDITLTAQQLEGLLRDVIGRTQIEEIYLVGHSQGGMIIRAMVQHGLGRDLPIRKCLFLSSPHQGTWVALVAIPHRGLRSAVGLLPYIRKVQGESGLQLMPTSDFIRRLNAQPLPEGIRFYSVHYALDPMIWPPTHAILPYPEADNHFVPKIGHAQPLYCSRAARYAMRSLYSDICNLRDADRALAAIYPEEIQGSANRVH
jgi:triacylglycerol esterase/lipase EstA (alpha/beta hydrolase family)